MPTSPVKLRSLSTWPWASSPVLLNGGRRPRAFSCRPDDTVKSEQDVERLSGLTTLGTVMRFGWWGSRQPVSGYGSRSPAAEAYRAIRTSVQFATMDRPGQVLLVTSPNAGDGKSTTAANLAVTMASAGKRVVLVDGDLRKPSLYQVFNLENRVGLTSALLSGDGTVLIQSSGFDNLLVLASGPLPPNPSELLSSAHARPGGGATTGGGRGGHG